MERAAAERERVEIFNASKIHSTENTLEQTKSMLDKLQNETCMLVSHLQENYHKGEYEQNKLLTELSLKVRQSCLVQNFH